MVTAETHAELPSWTRLFGRWELASIGGVAGAATVAAMAAAATRALESAPPALIYALLIAAAFVAGAWMGAAEGWALRERFDRAVWGPWRWTSGTSAALTVALGMAGGAASSTDAASAARGMVLATLPAGLMYGALSGIAQWALLRRHVRHAGGWIAASVVAWTSAGAAAAATLALTADSAAPAALAVGGVAATVVAGAVAGALRGAAITALCGVDARRPSDARAERRQP